MQMHVNTQIARTPLDINVIIIIFKNNRHSLRVVFMSFLVREQHHFEDKSIFQSLNCTLNPKTVSS